jgi:hypothetical protein
MFLCNLQLTFSQDRDEKKPYFLMLFFEDTVVWLDSVFVSKSWKQVHWCLFFMEVYSWLVFFFYAELLLPSHISKTILEFQGKWLIPHRLYVANSRILSRKPKVYWMIEGVSKIKFWNEISMDLCLERIDACKRKKW